MPARSEVRPRERLAALAATGVVQLAVGLVLLFGLRVRIAHPADVVERLVEIALPRSPPPVPPPSVFRPKPATHSRSAAPKAAPARTGGSPGPRPSPASPSVEPVVAIHPTAPAPGGGSGTGTASGSGSGGGEGGVGAGGDDDGGTDLVQIAGAIGPSDYPRDLRERGLGGRVGVLFQVGSDGRVTSCAVTRSSGVPELDALTCRLIVQRFRYRPSTDRYGRPIPDEVEGEQDWVAR